MFIQRSRRLGDVVHVTMIYVPEIIVFSDFLCCTHQSGETAMYTPAEEGQIRETDHTAFAILLAIFFPSVTGIMAGTVYEEYFA